MIRAPMRLAYFALQFPKLRETFVYNEVNEIRRNGVDIQVFSMLRPWEDRHLVKGYVISDEARHWLDETCYAPSFASPGFLLTQLRVLARHPGRYLTTVAGLFFRHHRTFADRLRTLKYCLLGAYFADQLHRKGGADHIHAHFAHGAATAAMAVSRLTGITWSFTSVAIDIFLTPMLLHEKHAHAAFSVTISDYNLRYLLEQYSTARPEKITVITHSVDVHHHVPRPAPVDNTPPRILSVAALYGFKGFPYLVEACRYLKEWGVPFVCDIIGEGPLGEMLHQMVRERHLENDVIFHGAQPQEVVTQFFDKADLFCLASIVDDNGERDGIPLVIMESMARGLPVVSTTVSGIPEAVEDGKSGCLAPEKDAEALASRLRLLLEDADLRRRMGQRGREIAVEKFNLQTNIGRLVALFREQAERNAAPPPA